jgi:hypothetical protein
VLILKLFFCSFGVLSLLSLLVVAGWLRLVSATRHIKPGPKAQIVEFPHVPVFRFNRKRLAGRRS